MRLTLGVIILTVAAAGTHASEFEVNTTDDHFDFVCDSDCSLRDAIYAANDNPGLDTINIPSGTFQLTLAGSFEDGGLTGDLDITEAVVLFGIGRGSSIIDATGLGDGAFHIHDPGGMVAFDGVHITGGDRSTSGGGILYSSMEAQPIALHLIDVEVSGNSATNNGGGIYTSGVDVNISASLISGNSSAAGAGIYVNDGTVLIDSSTISDNNGTGIETRYSNVTLTDSTVTGHNGTDCSGVLLYETDGEITGSTISHNTCSNASDRGAAVWLYASSDIRIENSTVYQNSPGAGVPSLSIDTFSTLTLHSTTVVESAIGGIAARNSGVLILASTIFAGTCDLTSGITYSYGGSVEGPGNTCGLTHTADEASVAALNLAPLGDYGGPTATVLPLAGSPAIDGGSPDDCLSIDQRGFDRSDGACDAGAVEKQPWDEDPIFSSGFESGDTTDWSATVGAS